MNFVAHRVIARRKSVNQKEIIWLTGLNFTAERRLRLLSSVATIQGYLLVLEYDSRG